MSAFESTLLDDPTVPAQPSVDLALVPDPSLTRKHFSRLRFYWMNRRADIQGGITDLDLQRLGLIQLSDGGRSYKATELGAALLAQESLRTRARRAPHQELGGRLAQWLHGQDRITWEGVEFKVREADVYARAHAMGVDASLQQGVLYCFPRPDVFSVVQTFEPGKICPFVHEVKVSRADFLADVAKPMKRLAYACIAEAVYYVTPAGMVEPHEVPQSCGLVFEVEPGVFKAVKRAKKIPLTLSPAHFMKMVVTPGTSSSTLASD